MYDVHEVIRQLAEMKQKASKNKNKPTNLMKQGGTFNMTNKKNIIANDNQENVINKKNIIANDNQENVINTEIEPTTFQDILDKLENNEEYSLFHPGIMRFKAIVNNLSNKEHFSDTQTNVSESNHIILENNKRIYPTQKGWTWLLNKDCLQKKT